MASSLDRYKVPILGSMVLGLTLLFDITAHRILAFAATFKAPPEDTIENAYRIRHEVYDHTLAPNFSTDAAIWWHPYSVRTNSLGFKDARVREVPMQTDRYRLLIQGDSFGEGIGVPFDQTHAGRIQAALGPETDVLNGSVSSYSPSIHRAKIDHWLERGLEIDEMVLFIDVSDAEDETHRYRYDQATGRIERGRGTIPMPGGYKTWIERNTLLTSAVVGRTRAAIWPEPAAAVWSWRSAWAWDDAANRDYGEVGSKRAAEHMSAIAARCRERGIVLGVVIYPYPDAIWRGHRTDRHTAHWSAWATAEGVDLLDLYPRFVEQEGMATLDTLFIPGDVHWSAAGHAVIAEEILAWRTRRGLREPPQLETQAPP